MDKVILLRVHHGLCSHFFSGKGYSEEFIKNMTYVLNLLNTQNLKVRFINGCDDICSCCPKNIDGKCENFDEVQITDETCSKEYGINVGDELLWSEVRKKVINKILSEEKLPQVCNNCQWRSICESINPKDL